VAAARLAGGGAEFCKSFAEISVLFKSYEANFLFGKFARVIFLAAHVPGLLVCYIVEPW
jgi:hypothetical protein